MSKPPRVAWVGTVPSNPEPQKQKSRRRAHRFISSDSTVSLKKPKHETRITPGLVPTSRTRRYRSGTNEAETPASSRLTDPPGTKRQVLNTLVRYQRMSPGCLTVSPPQGSLMKTLCLVCLNTLWFRRSYVLELYLGKQRVSIHPVPWCNVSNYSRLDSRGWVKVYQSSASGKLRYFFLEGPVEPGAWMVRGSLRRVGVGGPNGGGLGRQIQRRPERKPAPESR